MAVSKIKNRNLFIATYSMPSQTIGAYGAGNFVKDVSRSDSKPIMVQLRTTNYAGFVLLGASIRNGTNADITIQNTTGNSVPITPIIDVLYQPN